MESNKTQITIIPFQKVVAARLTVTDFVLLNLIYEKNYALLKAYVEYAYADTQSAITDLQQLERDGWCKITGNSPLETVHIRQPFIELITEPLETVSWIEAYRRLFGKARTGSMGDSKGVTQKMRKFMASNPQYSPDEIMTAARLYIQKCSIDNYKYMQQADYFISKEASDNTTKSNLLSYLEQLDVHISEAVNPGDTVTSINSSGDGAF